MGFRNPSFNKPPRGFWCTLTSLMYIKVWAWGHVSQLLHTKFPICYYWPNRLKKRSYIPGFGNCFSLPSIRFQQSMFSYLLLTATLRPQIGLALGWSQCRRDLERTHVPGNVTEPLNQQTVKYDLSMDFLLLQVNTFPILFRLYGLALCYLQSETSWWKQLICKVCLNVYVYF